jgi:uncharacterized repeat protein (TIGR03833 family)
MCVPRVRRLTDHKARTNVLPGGESRTFPLTDCALSEMSPELQKQHQRTGLLTRGVVQDVLTKSPTHLHGIKVRLETGEVGRVKEISSEE